MGFVTRRLSQRWKIVLAAAALQGVLSGCGWFDVGGGGTQSGNCPPGSTTCQQGNGVGNGNGNGSGGQSSRQFSLVPGVTSAIFGACRTGFAVAVLENGVETNSIDVDLRVTVSNMTGAEAFLGDNCSGPTQAVIPAGTTRIKFSFRGAAAGQARYQFLDANGGVSTTVQWINFIDPNSGSTNTPTPTPTNTPVGGTGPTNTFTPTYTPTNTPVPQAGHEIRMSPMPTTLMNGQCNSGYIVRTYVNGVLANPNGVSLDLIVPAETPNSVQFVTGSSCNSGGTTLNLAAGVTEGFVSIQAPAPIEGQRILRVRDENTGTGGFGELLIPVNFVAGNNPPTEATSILLVGPGQADAGLCAPVTVNALNGTVPAILAQPLSDIQLSFSPGDPPGTAPADVSGWYRNNTCLDSDLITSTTINAGASSTTVWFSTKRALLFSLRAVKGTMQSTIPHNVLPLANGPHSVRITSLVDSTTAGRCVPGVVALTDVYGNPIPTPSLTAVQIAAPQLSSVTSPAIWTDAYCSNAAANRTVNVAPGQTSASFFFRVDVASDPLGYRLEPTAVGYDTIPRYIVVLAASASQLVIDSVPAGVDADFAGSCVNLVVSLQDMYGNRTRNTTNGPMNVQVAFEPDLTSADPSDLSRAWLSAGHDCQGSRPTGGRSSVTIQIPDGGDNALASMVLYDAGTATVKATKTSPALPAVAQGRFAVPPPFVVLPGDPSVVRIVPRAAGLPAPLAGECIPVQYQLFDAYDNLTYARTNTPLQVHFADFAFPDRYPRVSLSPDCSSLLSASGLPTDPTVAITAAANTQGGTFYVTHTVAETFRMFVVGPAAIPPISASPDVLVTFNPNVPQQVVFLPESAPRTRELECSLPIVLEVRDQYGNASAPTSTLSFQLRKKSSTPVSTAVINFYADSGCSASGATFNLLNSARATFYVQTSVGGTYELEARVTNAGWPYPNFPYPVHVLSVLANQGLANLPVAVDFFGANGTLPSGAVRAGDKMGPFVLRPLNRTNAVVPSDQLSIVRIDGRTVVNRAPMSDLRVYFATNDTCGNDLLPNREVQIPLNSTSSQPFCISGAQVGARELVPVSGLMVGVRLGIEIIPGPVASFTFLTVSPAVGRCSPLFVESRDAFNNLAPIIPLTASNAGSSAIVRIDGLTQGAQIYSNRSCFSPIDDGELTFPAGEKRVGVYLLSNAVANYTAVPVNINARTLDPDLGIATNAQLQLANGYPSNRTLLLYGINPAVWYNVNGCYNASLALVQQNSWSTDPSTWAVVTYPAPGQGSVIYGDGTGHMYLGAGCASGGGQVATKNFGAGQAGVLSFSWRPTQQYLHGIVGEMNYAGRTLRTAVSFNVSAGACVHGSFWDAPPEYVNIGPGPGYFVYVYKRYLCIYGNWVLYSVGISRLNNGCFAPEAQIAIAGGLPKRADLVREGDELWNPVTRKPSKVLRIVKGPEKAGLIEIRAGDRVSRISSEHPMVTERGIKMAEDVRRGDKLRLDDGRFVKVASARRLPPRAGQMVYNFVLDVGDDATAEDRLIVGDGFVTGEWTLQKALRDNRDARKKGELP